MNQPIDIAIFGHILIERILFPNRELFPVLGSPAAYSSVCLGRLGANVGLVTKIGEDFPDALLETFDESSVDTQGISHCSSSTRNELIYNNKGEKRLIFLSKADPILATDFPDAYQDAKLLYICPIDNEISRDTLVELSKKNIPMVADLGGYGGGTSADPPVEKSGNSIHDLCPMFSVVKASLEDLRHIFGSDINERKAGELIIDWGAGACVVTLGEEGSYIDSGTRKSYIPPFSSTIKNIVDQTGAGDCFSAGLLFSLLHTDDVHMAAMKGTATTSYVIERTGGVTASRMPDRTEMERRAAVLSSSISG